MRRWSADRIILCSLVTVALVLPAAPASAETTPPDCDMTWTPAADSWDYSADTPTNWSPAGIPVATDVVCLPAAYEYGNYVSGGTITAAELHILSDNATIDGATNLQVPVIHSTSTPGGVVDFTWANLTGVTTLASGRIHIGSVEQLGYESVTSTFEVLEPATLVVNIASYQSTSRPLTVYGELNFVNAVDWSTWIGFSAPVSIPGTLRLSSPEWYADSLGCEWCNHYGLTWYTESTTHITGSVIVDDGILDLSNANLTVGQDPVGAVRVENGRTVLNGPAGGYLVSNSGVLGLSAGTQIQELNADLTLEGTGTVGTMSGSTFQSTLAALDTVRAGGSLTLRDSVNQYRMYGWGEYRRDSAAFTTTEPLNNHGSISVGPNSRLTAAAYTQADSAASTDFVFGATTPDPKLTATGQVDLNNGSVNLSVPDGRTFTPGARTLMAGSAVTRAPEVTTSGLPADTATQAHTVEVNPAGTALQLVTDHVDFDGEENRDATGITEYDGHYYELVPTTGTWIEAKNQAEGATYIQSPGHLVTISSGAENAHVDGLMPGASGSGYFGFSDQVAEGQFRWVTGEPDSYANWHPGEPNDAGGAQDCAHQYAGGLWDDIGCEATGVTHFVIEYDGPFDSDSDGDGVPNNADAFDDDASETADADGDGIGDNADADDTDGPLGDSDGDGSLNNVDAFPNDAGETVDADGDGTGDNADAFPNDPDETTDSDGDGTGDNAEARDSVDTTHPPDPVISASHSVSWSADPMVSATLSEVGDDAAGFAVVWDRTSDTAPDRVQTQPVEDTDVSSGALTSGTHYLHVRTVDAADNWSNPTHAGPFNIDLAAPTRAAVLDPQASLLPRDRDVEVSWSAATDDHSGTDDYTLEFARAPFTPDASDTWFAAAATTTGLSARLPLQLGSRNCMRVATRDQVGHTSWSAARCINVPFAATQFNESDDDGWSDVQHNRFAFGAAMVTYQEGATLRHRVSAKQVGIRAITCRKCGEVHLRWAGEASPFAAFDLRGEWTGVPAVRMAPVFTNRTTGKLIVEVASTNRRIAIDSIIVK